MVIFVHYPLATNYGPTFKGAVTNKAGDSHGAMSHDTTEILNVILPLQHHFKSTDCLLYKKRPSGSHNKIQYLVVDVVSSDFQFPNFSFKPCIHLYGYFFLRVNIFIQFSKDE